jgi:hypothetical protein
VCASSGGGVPPKWLPSSQSFNHNGWQ